MRKKFSTPLWLLCWNSVFISQHRPVQEDLITLIDVAVNGEYSKLSPIFLAFQKYRPLYKRL